MQIWVSDPHGVRHVDVARKVIDVEPAAGGRPPLFGGAGPTVHDGIRKAMLARYLVSDVPSYLDSAAAELLQEGRDAFNGLGLANAQVLEVGPDVVLFPWAGDRIMNTLTIALRSAELEATAEGVAIVIEDTDSTPSSMHSQRSPPDSLERRRPLPPPS